MFFNLMEKVFCFTNVTFSGLVNITEGKKNKLLGWTVGLAVGRNVGETEGSKLGVTVGRTVGFTLGVTVGRF